MRQCQRCCKRSRYYIGTSEVPRDIKEAWEEWHKDEGRVWSNRKQRYIKRSPSSRSDRRERGFSGIKYFIGGLEVPKWLYNAWDEGSDSLPYSQWLSRSGRGEGNLYRPRRSSRQTWSQSPSGMRSRLRTRSRSPMRCHSRMPRPRSSQSRNPRRYREVTPQLSPVRSSRPCSPPSSHPKTPPPPSYNPTSTHTLEPEVIDLAGTFKALYPEYNALHEEVTRLTDEGGRDLYKEEKLLRMHEYLDDLKDKIWKGAAQYDLDGKLQTLHEIAENLVTLRNS